MDEKELLKKAFKYGNVPSNITYCFTEPCPMKDKCIHYLSALYKNEETDRGDAIFPNALKNGKCKYFAPLRVVKMAWGFDKLFAEMKGKKQTSRTRNNDHKEVCHSPLSGLSVPFRRALRDQVMGIEKTSDGH